MRPKAGQHLIGIDISPGLAGTCTRVQATGDEGILLLAKPDLGADGALHETGQGFTFLQDRFGRGTAEAYRRLEPERIGPADAAWRTELLAALSTGDWEKLGGLLVNDLAPGVFEKYPILPLLETELRASGALGVAMTGSGPTLFALFADAAAVERQGAIWRERYPEFQIVAARGWSCRD